MSAESDTLTGIPEYQQLSELLGRETVLVSQLEQNEFATPEIKAAYERALDQVNGQAQELAKNPDLQSRVASIGMKCIQALQQIEPLRGILPDHEVEGMATTIQTQLSEISDYYEKFGCVTEEAQSFLGELVTWSGGVLVRKEAGNTDSAPAEPILPSRSEPKPDMPESGPKPVTITISKEGVQIGIGGKIVPYSQNVISSNYDEERKAVLRLLVERNGSHLSRGEIYEILHPGEEPPHDYKPRVIKWLDQLTFRRSPLFTTIRKHAAFKYGVAPSFNISIIESGEPTSETPQDPIKEGEAEEGLRHIRSSDLYILALKLRSLNEVLESFGKPIIEDEMVDRLGMYRPDLSHLRHNSELLKEYREQSLQNVLEVFEDDDKLLELIDCLQSNSPASEFIEMIYGQLESEDDKKFIRRLITARWTHLTVHRRGMPELLNYVLIDSNDVPIYRREGGKSGIRDLLRLTRGKGVATKEANGKLLEEELELEVEAEDQDDQAEVTVDEPEETLPIGAAEQDALETTDEEIEPLPFARRKSDREVSPGRLAQDKKREKFDELKACVEEVATAFLEHFDITESHQAYQLIAVIPRLSPKRLSAGREVGIGPRMSKSNATYSLEEVVRIMLVSNSHLKNVYQLRQNKPIVDRLIATTIAEVQTRIASSR